MIIVVFKIRCQPDKTSAVARAMRDAVLASRELPGVAQFDIATDLTDPNTLIATEVFDDAAAREGQEALPEVAKVMALLADALTVPPQVNVFEAA